MTIDNQVNILRFSRLKKSSIDVEPHIEYTYSVLNILRDFTSMFLFEFQGEVK